MTRNIDRCAYLFPIIVIPITFLMMVPNIDIIILDRIPWPWGQPGAIVARHSFALSYVIESLQSEFNIPLLYSILWILIGVVLIQMFYSGSSQRDLFYDLGVNLLVSAGILWIWKLVIDEATSLIAEWGPHTVISIPVLAMVLVPFQRWLMHNYKKRKNEDASEKNSEASH